MREENVNIIWPTKKGELRNRFMDSSIWNAFDFRHDDIIIASHPKSGTTWTQQVVAQLLFQGAEDIELGKFSSWLDRHPDQQEKLAMFKAQTHRRFVKTHLPADALIFSPMAKYLYIARDGRDIVLSYHHFMFNIGEELLAILNSIPGCNACPQITRPPEFVGEYFDTWLAEGGFNGFPFWEHVRSWWNLKKLPNVMLLHFSALKRDMPVEIRKIADFLAVPVDEVHWEAIVEHCSFGYMKSHADKTAPKDAQLQNSQTFFRYGKDRNWEGILTDEQSRRYEEMARKQLDKDCATWLLTGKI